MWGSSGPFFKRSRVQAVLHKVDGLAGGRLKAEGAGERRCGKRGDRTSGRVRPARLWRDKLSRRLNTASESRGVKEHFFPAIYSALLILKVGWTPASLRYIAVDLCFREVSYTLNINLAAQLGGNKITAQG